MSTRPGKYMVISLVLVPILTSKDVNPYEQNKRRYRGFLERLRAYRRDVVLYSKPLLRLFPDSSNLYDIVS